MWSFLTLLSWLNAITIQAASFTPSPSINLVIHPLKSIATIDRLYHDKVRSWAGSSEPSSVMLLTNVITQAKNLLPFGYMVPYIAESRVPLWIQAAALVSMLGPEGQMIPEELLDAFLSQANVALTRAYLDSLSPRRLLANANLILNSTLRLCNVYWLRQMLRRLSLIPGGVRLVIRKFQEHAFLGQMNRMAEQGEVSNWAVISDMHHPALALSWAEKKQYPLIAELCKKMSEGSRLDTFQLLQEEGHLMPFLTAQTHFAFKQNLLKILDVTGMIERGDGLLAKQLFRFFSLRELLDLLPTPSSSSSTSSSSSSGSSQSSPLAFATTPSRQQQDEDDEEMTEMFGRLDFNNKLDHARVLRCWHAANENEMPNLDRLNISLASSSDDDVENDSQTDQSTTFGVTDEQADSTDSEDEVEASRLPIAPRLTREREAARTPIVNRQAIIYPRGKKRKNLNGPESASKRQKY